MDVTLPFRAGTFTRVAVLSGDEERVVYRGWWHDAADGNRKPVLAVVPATKQPAISVLDCLVHEYSLKAELDSAWAARPIELIREPAVIMLLLEDAGGEPLERFVGAQIEIGSFLRLSIEIAATLGQVHRRGLVHKNLKPAHILANCSDGHVRLTGFGFASRLPRERRAPEAPEFIVGTLAYMAPEQTGQMNRSIDSRSDLYSLGVTLYQMLTGSLPFTASDSMEWVHCHIARRPQPPAERSKNIPAQLSAIITKLLAKMAEERYQTAAGLESDLRRCLAEWEVAEHIDPFALGEHDTPDRLLIPERLYGRAREVDTLLASFDRVIQSGAPELVLISGYSGIGKSSIVNELHKVLVPRRGLFASGKFEQYKRDIPYSTLVQALQSLVRPLLSKSDTELASWRHALANALNQNGQLVVDLVPELRLVIGEPPSVPELPSQDAQRRFQLVFRRFIGVFARPEHPLVLFLDDLQWLDAATLDLLENLLTQGDAQHLMLIGAYRDNEVDVTHLLTRKLRAIKNAGAKIEEITLAPLACEHLGQLLADALFCGSERAAPLAQLVLQKTGGNPYFAIKFISALAEDGFLTFDHDAAAWSWDLNRIQGKGYTDNVVHLMIGKLHRLPPQTREALQQLACLGNMSDISTLCAVRGAAERAVHSDLWEALREDLVLRLDGFYKFVHDRVQEAAYSLIPPNSRAEAHLRIGRLLAAQESPELRAKAIFETVNHLNRGAALITSFDEREQVAELNLIAGKRAKASTAYSSALTYLVAGAALLDEKGCWERQHELIFQLELNRAECEFLTGALTESEERLAGLSTRAANAVERAAVACLRVDLYTSLTQYDNAVAVCIDYLRYEGIDWSPHPTEEDVRREYDRVWSQIRNRTIEELIDLPLTTDPATLATLDVLTKVLPPAQFTDARLFCLVASRAVSLSLESGNSDGSCVPYVMFGMVAGVHFGDYKNGFRFGQLGYDLVERRGMRRFQARTYATFANSVMPSLRHVLAARALLRRAFEVARESGDLNSAAYICLNLNMNFLAAGDPLVEAQREAEQGLEFARKARFRHAIHTLSASLALIRTLRGLTPKFDSFTDEKFDGTGSERDLVTSSALAMPAYRHWVRTLQVRFLAGDFSSAVDAALRAERLLWASPAQLESAEYHFYGALSRAAAWDRAPVDQRQRHIEALTVHHRQLQVWADNCPENFENRAALVGAEIARIEGRDADAMRLYEQAISSAHSNGFVHNEAIANEVAARFYTARGFEKFARVCLQDARYGYLRWGALGKVRQLDHLHPHLREEERAPGPTSTIDTPLEHLDLGTVVRVLQVVSSEIVLEKLLHVLMRTAIEHAGAERGLLILPRGAEQRIETEATTSGDAVMVRLRDEPVNSTLLPESIIHYVLRTREDVILDDASAPNPFGSDTYIRQHHARSVLCLPLINQAKLIGVLYLENNLAARVFTATRIAVLKLLASQAAISLENTRLYSDLQARQIEIRRLVDCNIIGIVISGSDGRIWEANDAYLDILGYSRDDLLSSRMRWSDLTPPEWQLATERAWEDLRETGISRPFEKEYFRKDGSRVPVLVGGATLDENGERSVGFVLDLSERKRAEAEAYESERRYREVQMELAHANRVATMGQLTASIAHEVAQPIAAAVTNAQAGLRWLGGRQPDLEEVRQALSRIVANAGRAGDVISRIRKLVKKAPGREEPVQINEAILEVIALTHSETLKHGISVRTQLAEDLPLVRGDRVQLQQVVLNLIINAIEALSGTSQESPALLIGTGQAKSDEILVAVADSGPGLASASFERLFEAFYTTKPDGLGMGLAICRSIIEAHGGRLSASANAPHGATFQFTVPTYRDASL